MVKTKKASMYAKCRELTNNDSRYANMYRKTSLEFWIREHRLLVYGRLHKTEMIKIILGTRVPLEIYFKIMGYIKDE